MTKYIVYQWNGHQWTLDNSVHAIVRAGPYDTTDEAVAAINKADVEATAEGFTPGYVLERTAVMPASFPSVRTQEES